VSDMFLHRHSKDPNPETRSPPPDLVLSNRRFWYLRTIRTWLAAAQAKGKTRGPATITAAAALLLLVVAVNHQIWGPFTPAATRGWDPRPYIAMETAAVQAFPLCRATACRADVRQITTDSGHAFSTAEVA
jgi:hypothetical protein